MMKLLAIHTASLEDKNVLPVDIWRVARPIRELRKHVDWDITERPTVIKQRKEYEGRTEFSEFELEQAAKELGEYDVIYGSYVAFMNPSVFTLCMVVEKRYGTKVVMDVDDNVFAINPDNIGWWTKMGHEDTFKLQQIVRHANFITTTSEILAKEIHERNPVAQIAVVPNYISKDYRAEKPQNERLRIGYFGGASHYSDLHDSGVLEALQKLMHENKNIEFESCGIPIETYLPKARYAYNQGKRGHAWITDIVPNLKYDIAIAPLLNNDFNKCKSDIKWQESTVIHSPLIASNVSPYKETIRNGYDGILVANDSSEWYKALKELVGNKTKREELVANAKTKVDKLYIEDNYKDLKKALEIINENYQAKQEPTILQTV